MRRTLHWVILTIVFCTLQPKFVFAQSKSEGSQETQADGDTYDEGTIFDAASNFFGGSTEGLAKVIQKVFNDLGQPNAYIAGEEISGAFVVGLRYGDGKLTHIKLGERRVYWKGPSAGFDFGGNASKSFTLIYHLNELDPLFQRFPGIDGSIYYVGGVGVNYQQRNDIILAPIRLGVGLRAGVNVGYLHYTENRSWNPF
ncbi:MAG: DUF1134 domain-containing protein [Rhodospirillales bacterium]|nr:DUF1134 domain-containing protein [Rhodospirillales bacterium]